MQNKFEQQYRHVNGIYTVYSQDRIDDAQKDIDEYLRLKEKVKQYGGIKMGKYKRYIEEQDDKTWKDIAKLCRESEAVDEVLFHVDIMMTKGQMFLPIGYTWTEFEEQVRDLWDEIWEDYKQEVHNENEQAETEN